MVSSIVLSLSYCTLTGKKAYVLSVKSSTWSHVVHVLDRVEANGESMQAQACNEIMRLQPTLLQPVDSFIFSDQIRWDARWWILARPAASNGLLDSRGLVQLNR
mmetsp:Transcript_36726/g.89411  ORF Transcript_36726/g.89411 Transcript_36726/m.89411 type:complete len:104 (-) Transcript_36726:504-815(-)